MKKLSLAVIVCNFVLLASTSTLAGQSGYYRWQDETGEVHYSQQPPKNQQYEFIADRRMRSRTAESEPDQSNLPTVEDADADSQAAPEKMEVLPAKDPKLCRQAKENLKTLNASGSRIRITQANGGSRFLNQDEITEQKQRAEQAASIYCK
ncbi:MAG: DUF4124 domain-containing protein [Spongiibacteraceae bacterium]